MTHLRSHYFSLTSNLKRFYRRNNHKEKYKKPRHEHMVWPGCSEKRGITNKSPWLFYSLVLSALTYEFQTVSNIDWPSSVWQERLFYNREHSFNEHRDSFQLNSILRCCYGIQRGTRGLGLVDGGGVQRQVAMTAALPYVRDDVDKKMNSTSLWLSWGWRAVPGCSAGGNENRVFFFLFFLFLLAHHIVQSDTLR